MIVIFFSSSHCFLPVRVAAQELAVPSTSPRSIASMPSAEAGKPEMTLNLVPIVAFSNFGTTSEILPAPAAATGVSNFLASSSDCTFDVCHWK